MTWNGCEILVTKLTHTWVASVSQFTAFGREQEAVSYLLDDLLRRARRR